MQPVSVCHAPTCVTLHLLSHVSSTCQEMRVKFGVRKGQKRWPQALYGKLNKGKLQNSDDCPPDCLSLPSLTHAANNTQCPGWLPVREVWSWQMRGRTERERERKGDRERERGSEREKVGGRGAGGGRRCYRESFPLPAGQEDVRMQYGCR